MLVGINKKMARVSSDNCSHELFMTESVKNALYLNAVRSEMMLIIRGFGAKNKSDCIVDVARVEVSSLNNDSFVEVELFVVPIICTLIHD